MLAAEDIVLCHPRSLHEINTQSWTSKCSLHVREEGSSANEEDELGATPEGVPKGRQAQSSSEQCFSQNVTHKTYSQPSTAQLRR